MSVKQKLCFNPLSPLRALGQLNQIYTIFCSSLICSGRPIPLLRGRHETGYMSQTGDMNQTGDMKQTGDMRHAEDMRQKGDLRQIGDVRQTRDVRYMYRRDET